MLQNIPQISHSIVPQNIHNNTFPFKTPCPQGEDTGVAAGTSLPRWHHPHFPLAIAPGLE